MSLGRQISQHSPRSCFLAPHLPGILLLPRPPVSAGVSLEAPRNIWGEGRLSAFQLPHPPDDVETDPWGSHGGCVMWHRLDHFYSLGELFLLPRRRKFHCGPPLTSPSKAASKRAQQGVLLGVATDWFVCSQCFPPSGYMRGDHAPAPI